MISRLGIVFHPTGDEAAYGQWGDYIGGVWGTLIAGLALIALFLTWRSSSRADSRNSTISILSEMLKTHDQISATHQDNYVGDRGTPAEFLSEFYKCYKIVSIVNKHKRIWNLDERIDIAYTFTYYGTTTHTTSELSKYDQDAIKIINDHIGGMRHRGISAFQGYHKRLGHYMRNLFSMYSFVNRSRISRRDKLNLAKIIRSKLSNYEQALLALNIISHFGAPWRHEKLVNRYAPIRNVPKQFFSFDTEFDIKKAFPQIKFEWETH